MKVVLMKTSIPPLASCKIMSWTLLLGSCLSLSAGDIGNASQGAPPGAAVKSPPLLLGCTAEASMPKWQADAYPFDMQAKALWEESIAKWKSDTNLGKEVEELHHQVSFQAGAFAGKDALAVEVTHPRILQQYLTYPLDKTENGKTWAEHGYNYLSFWYQTAAMEGEINLVLDGAGGEYSARVTVRPGKWTQVVLPFSGFWSTSYTPVPSLYKPMKEISGIDKIKIRSDPNSLRAPGKILFADFEVAAFSRPEFLEEKPCVLTLRPGGGTPDQERPAALFDMGTKPPESLELVFRFPKRLVGDTPARASFAVTDFSFHTLALGETPVSTDKNDQPVAVVRLGREDARKFYYSEFFEYQVSVKNAAGGILAAETVRVTDLNYAGRDAKELAPRPESWEETSYGRLKLVDDIDCSVDPSLDEHPYKEGGITWGRWALRKYYYYWQDGISVEEILGRKSRVAANSSWFSYRIGRNLKPGQTYVLRVEYPEDKPRYAPMDIALGANYTCPGLRTGVGPDDPFDNYPLSGKYECYDNIVAPDELGYGYKGGRTASSVNGFWVSFIDAGGHYRHTAKTQYAGPAVSRIKLYEIDPEQNAPKIILPAGLPGRILMTGWERQPEFNPRAAAQIAKLMGWNAIAPETLKWHFAAYWPTRLGYIQEDPAVPFVPLPKDKIMNTHLGFLDAAQKVGIYLIPRIEYGGSKDLPQEARCVGPDGGPAKMVRYATWGADLLHPATLQEVDRLIDEVMGAYIEKYPCLKKGLLWRMRCGRMTISYSQFDVELFCKENNLPVPPGDSKALARWASSGDTGKQYETWWQKKRMEFNLKIRDKLRSIDPEMKLFYYNWDQDGWMLSDIMPTTPREFELLYDNETKNWLYEKQLALFGKLKNSDLVNMVETLTPPIQKAAMNNYRDANGVAFFAPVCLRYVADNPEYLAYFKTGDGLAVDHQVLYEETIAYYSQRPKFEGSMINPAGPAFAMAPELWAWFYGDVNTLSFSTYTFGRGFADSHRRFAQAFLALPAIPGTVVDQGDKDVKVRTYSSANGTYVGVAHKGYTARKLTIKVPAGKPDAVLKNLVTGQTVPTTAIGNDLQFELDASPMELDAFLIP